MEIEELWYISITQSILGLWLWARGAAVPAVTLSDITPEGTTSTTGVTTCCDHHGGHHLLSPPDLSVPSTPEGSGSCQTRGSLVPWCRWGTLRYEMIFMDVKGGVSLLQGQLNPSSCRKHPILSVWGWIFTTKPVPKCLLSTITSTENTHGEGEDAALRSEVRPLGLSHYATLGILGHRSSGFSSSSTFSIAPTLGGRGPSVCPSPPAPGVGSDPRLLIIVGQPGAAVPQGRLGRGPCAAGLGGSGGPGGAVLAPGGGGPMPQRGGDTRGALARPVVPPGTHLGPQLQLVDGGHTLGLLQAPPGLGHAVGPGSPRGLSPQPRPLCLPRGWELGGSSCGFFGFLAPHPHGAQGLRPAGQLLHHPVIAGGLRDPTAPPEPPSPIPRAAASPGFTLWRPRSLGTASPCVRGWVALPCPLGTVPSGTALAPPLCRAARGGGGPGGGRAGFDGGFNPAVRFGGLAGGVSG